MSEFVARLQERPRQERIALATTAAVAVVLLLLGVWILFFFAGIRNDAKLSAVRSAGTQPITPSEFIDQVNDISAAYAQEEAAQAALRAQQAAAAAVLFEEAYAQQSEAVYVDGITVPATSTPPASQGE